MPALPQPQGDFAKCPEGNHLAVCYRVIHVGTQRITYKGETKNANQVMLTWELPDEKMDDGRPFSISRKFTWSMHEKAALRKTLESWRGKAFDDHDFREPADGGFNIRSLLGKACMVNVVHEQRDGKTYANLAGVAKLPKGLHAPSVTINPTVYVWLHKDEFDKAAFDTLSDNMKMLIAQSPEYQAITASRGLPTPQARGADVTDLDDEIPF